MTKNNPNNPNADFKGLLGEVVTTIGQKLNDPDSKPVAEKKQLAPPPPMYSLAQGVVPEGSGLCMSCVYWISTKRKSLPQEGRNIVVQLKGGMQIFGRMIKGKFCWYNFAEDKFLPTTLQTWDNVEYFAYTSPVVKKTKADYGEYHKR